MNTRDEIREENMREIRASYYRRLAGDDYSFHLAGGIIAIAAVSLGFLTVLNLCWKWWHG